jgi:outer membrane protein assembly factor BamA
MFRHLTFVSALAFFCALTPDAAADEPVAAAAEPVAVDDESRADGTSGTATSEAPSTRPRFIGFPIVGYTPDTSWAFGALARVQWSGRSASEDAGPSSLTFGGGYTLKRQWTAHLAPSLVLDGGRTRMELDAGVARWSSSYFGTGPDARFEDEEIYGSLRYSLGASFARSIAHEDLFIGLAFDGVDTRIRTLPDGGLLERDAPVGLAGARLIGLGPTITWDSRDVRLFPTRGAYASFQVLGYHRAWGSEFDLAALKLDVRGYTHVGPRETHVLAGRLVSRSTLGDVPFWAQTRLGGANLLRGMTHGRVRDRNLWALQGEYRSPFIWRIGFVAFAGIGDVHRSLDWDAFASPRWSTGAGVRLRVDEASGLNVRIDYGLTHEEFDGIYLSITEAF